MQLHAKSRRAFTLVPLVLILALILVALGIALWALTPPTPTGNAAYDSGRRMGQLMGPPLFALVFTLIASRLAERRSEASANLICGGILGLAVLATGVNVLRAAGLMAPTAKSAAPSPAPAPIAPIPTPPPAHTPRPRPAPAPPAPAAPPTPTPEEQRRKAQEAQASDLVEAFRADLQAKLDALAPKARELYKANLAPPAHSKKILAERKAAATALATSLSEAADSLNSARETLAQRLTQAQLETSLVQRVSIEFSIEFGSNHRAFAANQIRDFTTNVIKECDLLDANFSAWSLQKNQITCKDPNLKAKLTQPRFFMQSQIDSSEDALAGLTKKSL